MLLAALVPLHWKIAAITNISVFLGHELPFHDALCKLCPWLVAIGLSREMGPDRSALISGACSDFGQFCAKKQSLAYLKIPQNEHDTIPLTNSCISLSFWEMRRPWSHGTLIWESFWSSSALLPSTSASHSLRLVLEFGLWVICSCIWTSTIPRKPGYVFTPAAVS